MSNSSFYSNTGITSADVSSITSAKEAAATSETNAATSATNAATSSTNAATSATNAATSETNASNSAATATTSAANASTSETNASASAATATTQASNAATSATAAAGSASTAGTSATNAASSATNAATSETNAATSETNAANSATSAATSATNAGTSETNAAASASSASGYVTSATTQANNAATSATAAATSETNAASSATAASTSASGASTSASNANTSATNAASSASQAATSAAAAALAADNFDDTYLGSNASDPTTDNDGDALNAGDLHFNTTSNTLKVYNGSAWQDAAIDSSGFVQTTGDTMTGALDVQSTITADGLTVDGSSTIATFLRDNGANGSLALTFPAQKATLTSLSGFKVNANGVDRLDISTTGDISFYEDTGTTAKFFWDASAESLTVEGFIETPYISLGNTGNSYQTVTGSSDGNDLTYRAYQSHIFKNTTGASSSTDGTERMRISSAGDVELIQSNNLYWKHQGGGTIRAGITADSSDNLTFSTGSSDTTRMTLDGSGRVGIGTSSPNTGLSVVTGSANGIELGQDSDASTDSARLFFSTSAGSNAIHSSSGALRFFTASTAGSSTGTERMRIDSSGNVGIGRTPNSVLLDVQGSTNDTFTAARFRNRGQVVGSAVKAVWSLNRDGSDVDYEAGAISVHKTQQWTTAPSSIDSYMAFSTNNSESVGERMRIDSSGNLLVGKTSTDINVDGSRIGGFGAILTRSGNEPLRLNRRTSDGDIIKFDKDGTTVGSIGNRDADDIFINTAGGTGSLSVGGTEYYAWSSGAIYPWTDNARDLGAASNRWDDVYATNGTIQTSDRNEKQDIAELSDAEQRVAVAAKGLLRKFRWKDAVAEKGDEARTHFGIIAQDLQAAFAAEGLDAGDYAMFISSTWTDEETGEEKTRMGVRYSELLAFIIAAI